MEGAETLVEIAISTNGANVWQDVVWAMWRTAHLSASPPQYIRFTKTLKRCIEGGGQVANQLKSLFVSMVCHSFDGSEKSEEVDLQLTKVGISDEECRLVKAIHHLVREETEFARQMAKEKVESNSPNTAWFGLIQGLCALQCGDLNGLSEARHTSERPETSSQWAVLEAAACSRLGHAKAMEHLCDLIQHCFLDQTHATTTLPLSGILSYLGCLQQEKEKVAVVLGKLGYDALLTDSEAPLAYLRAASLMGLGNRAMNIFEQNIVLIQQSKNDFQNLYYHATTQAIEENQYEEAYALLTKAVKRD